ncbi:hypothetical protein CHUAL_002396 [Chamberlinius hualienensis]
MAVNHGFHHLSVPGFHNIFLNKQPLYKRLLLLVIIMVFGALSVFQIVERVSYYMTMPTSITYEFKVESMLRYPSISICSYYGLDGPSVKEEIARRNVSNIYELLNTGMDLENIWQLSGDNLIHTITKCRYGGINYCVNSTLWKINYSITGTCYTFEFKKLVPYTGFISSYLSSFGDKWKSHARVIIHDITFDISYAAFGRGVPIYPRTAATVFYFHRVIEYVNSSNRPCYDVDTYSRCVNKCYDLQVLKNHTCRLPFIPPTRSNLTLCSTPEEFRAVYPYSSSGAVEAIKKTTRCSKRCGQSCIKYEYDVTVDTRNTEISDKFTRLIVAPLREGTHLYQEKRVYFLDALFCDIGAILGFYLGISFLTLIEFFEQLFYIVTNRRK